jgi:hypothetical protein
MDNLSRQALKALQITYGVEHDHLMERVVANLEWFLKDREDTFHAYEE